MTTIESAEDFVKWATHAKPNARASYFRGYLFKERVTNHPTRREGINAAPHFRLANKAWEFYELGVVKLFQKRMGDEDYLYIAVKA